MKECMNKVSIGIIVASMLTTWSCAPVRSTNPVVPSKIYADSIRNQGLVSNTPFQSAPQLSGQQAPRVIDPRIMPLGRLASLDETPRGRVRLVSDDLPLEEPGPGNGIASDEPYKLRRHEPQAARSDEIITNDNAAAQGVSPGYYKYESSMQDRRDYAGPLSYGEPGVSSSLWKESRAGNDLWRDFRAWQPMDLITITVSESSEGKKAADTEIKQKSTIELAIEKLFGLENRAKAANDGADSGLDPTALINASSQNDFKGEGKTNRKDTLKAKISAMVAEVLPSGILRIEGQKIIAVNSEEQIMVISGLVRPRDINSENDVASSKIANMRIDYFGKGTVDEAQHGGWASRLIRTLWPF